MLGKFAFLSPFDFFNIECLIISFRNAIRMSNSLDTDQTQQDVGPHLCPNFLQRFSADDKSRH